MRRTTVVNEQEGKPSAAAGTTTLVRIRVRDLMRGAKEVVLELDGQDYRLRITASGKLILTK